MKQRLVNTWRLSPIVEFRLGEIVGSPLLVRGTETGRVGGGIGTWREIGASGVFVCAFPQHRKKNYPMHQGVFIRVEPQRIGDFGVNLQDNDALNLRPMDSKAERTYQNKGASFAVIRELFPDDGLQLRSDAPVAHIRIGTASGEIEPLEPRDPGISFSYDWAVQFDFEDGSVLSLSTSLSGVGSLDGDVALRSRPLAASDYSHLDGITATWRELTAVKPSNDELPARHN